MSASSRADNQPGVIAMEKDTSTSLPVPTLAESQRDTTSQTQMNDADAKDDNTDEERERRAKSSSPLSQFDEDARAEREQLGSDFDELGYVGEVYEDMSIDDDEDEGEAQEELADQVSETTIQPPATPSQPGLRFAGNDRSGDINRGMDEDERGPGKNDINHENELEYDDDDDADERQSSVTSSTIPLTSLDDSPNQRQRAADDHVETERHSSAFHLEATSSSEAVGNIAGPLAESGTLSSIAEAGGTPLDTETGSMPHDDDGSDLTEDDVDDDEEDEEVGEHDDDNPEDEEDNENDGNEEIGEDDEDEEEAAEEDEENAEEHHVVASTRQNQTYPNQQEKEARRTSLSPSLSPPSSVISLPRHNEERKQTASNSKINGTTSSYHQNTTSGPTSGNEAKSPSKTLKLTLKLSMSPPNAARQEGSIEMLNGGDKDDQEAEGKQNIVPVKKNPTPTSHGRKPSIFGSSTMEDEQQQDEAEPEDGELSEEEEDAVKTEKKEETGVASGSKAVMVEEETAGDSEAEERPPSTLSSAPSQPTLEALAALLKIEIKFAALRDQLYIERMNEITKEEEMVVNGTHRSLVYLHNILEARHDNLLRLADLRQKEFEIEAVKVRDYDKKMCFSWWNDSKIQLVKHEYESNARKRRRIEKDKHDFDMPKPVPKPLPPKNVTAQDRQARAFDWNAGPAITPLHTQEISNDLLAMGVSLHADP
ncbi:hypothetical protein QFC19_001841 [Naganishia cerealis]|uniref:Uncharacterized protein n=1 Tax=Naganishia cerealis TaxID=610337 RepID=A0ACC2WH40_9TREE|nr:hypothetical protein QFC19_001841 [Naganishia cerealis]